MRLPCCMTMRKLRITSASGLDWTENCSGKAMDIPFTNEPPLRTIGSYDLYIAKYLEVHSVIPSPPQPMVKPELRCSSQSREKRDLPT